MNYIGFDKKFSLLAQEAHLTKNTLLSGFDLLLKANFYQDKDGYFYSAFFHLSIGIERVLKLVVVTHYMLTHNYKTPTVKQLKKDFGHDIRTLYNKALKLLPTYLHPNAANLIMTKNDDALIDFFTEYGVESRYFNLNEVCEEKHDRSPLYKWVESANAIYEEYTPYIVREKSKMNLFYQMDREGQLNVFTSYLDEIGHPMMVFDLLHRQLVIKKSTPFIIWRLIEILRPIYFLFDAMACKAAEYENKNGIKSMVIPHYSEFFLFLLADKQDIKRRKRWLEIFNS